MAKEHDFTFQHPQPQGINPQQYGNASIEDTTAQINELQSQLAALSNRRINFNSDLIGLYQTVAAIPTQVPSSPYQQVQLLVNASLSRIYAYDTVGASWRYATLT